MLLWHLKGRKLPLQHRWALGIFCRNSSFSWLSIRAFLCIQSFLLFPGRPMLACAMPRPTQRSDLSDLGTELPAPVLHPVSEQSSKLTSHIPEQEKTGLGGREEERFFSQGQFQTNKTLTTLYPYLSRFCITHTVLLLSI